MKRAHSAVLTQSAGRFLVAAAAVVVFLFLLLIAPRTNHPTLIRGLAVAWPVVMALVSAWSLRRRRPD